MFVPPSWPASIPLPQHAVDEDKSLRELQGQWGMAALALSRGIVKLESAALDTISSAEADPASVGGAWTSLKDSINAQVAVPLAHALWLAWYFNDLSLKHRRRIASGGQDQQLGKWLEAAPETTTCLFPEDVNLAMEAARAR